MLEGLEAAEILWSEFVLNNDYIRLDSEFQNRERKDVIETLKNIGAVQFGEGKPVIIHPHEISRSYVEDSGVWFFRAQNNRPMMIEASNKVFISQDDANSLTKNHLRKNDVVVTRTGANAGDCALFDNMEQAVASSHTFIIRSKEWRHSYLTAFFNSRFGRVQIITSRYGAAQPEVAPYYLRNIWIPKFTDKFYQEIDEQFKEAHQATNSAHDCLNKAEITLLKTLELDSWMPPTPLSYVRSSNDAFTAGRFDAEYFHPAKTSALSILDNLSDARVGDFFESIRDLWQPSKSKEAAVRNHDLTDALEPFLDPTKVPTLIEEIRSTKKLVQPGDLVVSRLRSYLREIAVVLPGDGTTTVVSTEYIVLRPKKSSPLAIEALLIYLRSQLPQIVFKWSQDGSNHPRFDENELLNIPIPRALISNQENYVKAMQEMISQRQLAASLLEAAKRSVEIAIEDSEAAALAYLQGGSYERRQSNRSSLI
ncbi:TPA: hypothetical protein I6203_002450 [Vibrio cholerae]|nr:hypothetical protein [Vibrio cholerae]